MNHRHATRAIAFSVLLALALIICLGSTAEIAPAPPTGNFTEPSKTPEATAAPEATPDANTVSEADGQEQVKGATLDETSTKDEDVIENPTEEEKFISDLMTELDINEANALEKVNGMTHILLIGIDARPGQDTGRSDTMLLLTIDPDNKCLKLTSFMRDLYVEIPGHKNNRLNAAYVFGGPNLFDQDAEKELWRQRQLLCSGQFFDACGRD